jgi:hypothetical protein
VPAPVAIGRVAVRAEPCVVEPGGVDLGEGQGRPERLRNPLRFAGVDGITVSVVRGDALEQEVPSFWIAAQQEGGLLPGVSLLPLVGELSRCHKLDASRGRSADPAGRTRYHSCHHEARVGLKADISLRNAQVALGFLLIPLTYSC